ncbi:MULTISPECIES: hypothetical protein [Legionella]|uniref:Uncharacterized protein n=1 Tax=Legionella drozanskii LLAP-1 TaxID=1212489 RepID=A0A0W0TAJ3_9GAMM|nr:MULTISPECIES: hypothetical protein [Legionella]KTC92586.1 hypothetical protein Ldro_0576 [Legionella drozanskii LLAP-1]PJE12286.1 MAG: hypothetical protein CK430_07770 [Legionella sp.]
MQTKFEQAPSQKSTHSTEYLKLISKLITSVFLFYDKTAMFKVKPIVQGSMGLLLHGVDFPEGENPDDVDIVVSQPALAQQIMLALAEQLKTQESPYQIQTFNSRGPRLVYDFDIVDTSGKHPNLKIQLINKEDFGLSHVTAVEKEGIPVLPAKEAFMSLEDRIEKAGSRKKDKYAYFTLLDLYGEEFIKDSYFIETGKSRELKDYLALSTEERHHLRDAEEAPKRGRTRRMRTHAQEDMFTVPTISGQHLADSAPIVTFSSSSQSNSGTASQVGMFKQTSSRKQDESLKDDPKPSSSSHGAELNI